MDHRDVGRLWEQNSVAWTELARDGFDVCRDLFNSPGFFAMLPDVAGLRGLDIGCGEGHNTRQVAGRGARMTAVDISRHFAARAREADGHGRFARASAVELPFADASFDFVVSFMSFMDVPEQERVVAEACRVLRPGGFLQFSISHPCFMTLEWEWVYDGQGKVRGVICGNYFDAPQGTIEEWTFSQVPKARREEYPPFRVPRFPRTLSGWFNLLAGAGFTVERLGEPKPDDATVEEFPFMLDARQVAYFLHFLCRKST